MKTWLITDTHLNHNNIKTYCQRPDDHTERIDANIRRMVSPNDILIHLGDIGIGKTDVFMPTVQKWPGKKWLIRGNHDTKSCQWYVQNGFDMACDGLIYRGAWLTHKPWRAPLPRGTHINIHGHLHNVWDGFLADDPEKQKDEFFISAKKGKLLYPWQRLLAVEYTNYMPVEFDKFVAKGWAWRR
ncbi:MAG TPA: metallophosphoesterase [Candidatus Paceibacterota bacterium]|jgi:calcineurin-like phosphoesterase family protein|nr:metallophosphoesterase [Candidatus Paceibacterota bacterium]